MRGRDIAVVGIVTVLVLLFFGSIAAGITGYGGMMGPGMMGGYYGPGGYFGSGYSPWWGLLMLFFLVLVIAGIVLLIVWFFRQGGRTVTSGRHEETALDILKRRYANGEITKQEYDQMRRDIE